jgi:GAF domain-containing protein
MYEQVGHTPEGQRAMSLPIGSGSAGQAFVRKEAVYEADIETSSVFQPVPHGSHRGSIACVPIRRGEGVVTGVLSVLSTSTDAFRFPELLYFEALASAIGAIEVLESSN